MAYIATVKKTRAIENLAYACYSDGIVEGTGRSFVGYYFKRKDDAQHFGSCVREIGHKCSIRKLKKRLVG